MHSPTALLSAPCQLATLSCYSRWRQADSGFWKGAHLSDCPLPSCSPTHLNDLVNVRLFTDAEGAGGEAADWELAIDCESAGEWRGKAHASRASL